MVKLDLHYVDPRLVELYDRDNPRGPDTDFYLQLADELGASRIVDLGCGTGLLTRELARDGREVVGVDPSAAMLAYAGRQPGAGRVRWVEGDASALNDMRGFDLALMTGNVAQVFLEDADWHTALKHLRQTLRPGGTLAFETRNPEAREWERWNPDSTYGRSDSPNGPMEEWLEVVGVEGGRVRMVGHNVFLDSGEHLAVDSELRFRTREEIEASLRESGFQIDSVYGNWSRGPVLPTSPVMVFVARGVPR